MNDLKKLELIKEFLELSGKDRVTAECILTVINTSKKYPNMSVVALLMHALQTWDCLPDIKEIN